MMKKLLPILFVVSIIACTNEPPKILIIGDSISIGYTPHVKEMLGDNAFVSHNKGNAEHTGTGLERVTEWIGDEEWDIIQFNWGLWDLAYRSDSSKVQGMRDKINGEVTFTADQYAANLDSLVVLIKSLSKAKLLFVSTSYVPEGESGRFVEDALIYNKVAFEIMNKHDVPVNDIYELSKEVHNNHSTGSDNVHYTKDGYKLLAQKITEGLSGLNRRLKAK